MSTPSAPSCPDTPGECRFVTGLRELLQFKGWHISLRVEQDATGAVSGSAVFTRTDGETFTAPCRGSEIWSAVVATLAGAHRATAGIDRERPL